MVKETTPHQFVFDLRDEDLFDFERVGYCKVPTADIVAEPEKFSKPQWFRVNGQNEAEIEISFRVRDQSEGEDLVNAVREGNLDKVKKLVEEDKKGKKNTRNMLSERFKLGYFFKISMLTMEDT